MHKDTCPCVRCAKKIPIGSAECPYCDWKQETPWVLNPETLYCRKCRKEMPVAGSRMFCGGCGWDQSQHFDAEKAAMQQKAQQEETRKKDEMDYRERKRREAEEDMKPPKADATGVFTAGSSLNPQNPYAMEEYTRQYTSLYWYIALAVIGFITGPVAIGLFIYAIVQQNALRRRVAEMGVDPDDLSSAAKARFWDTLQPILSLGMKGVAIIIAIIVVFLWTSKRF